MSLTKLTLSTRRIALAMLGMSEETELTTSAMRSLARSPAWRYLRAYDRRVERAQARSRAAQPKRRAHGRPR